MSESVRTVIELAQENARCRAMLEILEAKLELEKKDNSTYVKIDEYLPMIKAILKSDKSIDLINIGRN